MKIPMNVRVAWLCAALSLSTCSSYPADSTSCPDTVCSSHGTCTWKASFPTCACAPGYTGVVCGQCDVGFHLVSDGSCVADATCEAGSCGDHGECSIVNGQRACTCALGYTGATCSDCRAGYSSGVDGCTLDQVCTATSCANGGTCTTTSGRVSCQCATGFSGAFCEVAMQTCAQNNPCSSHGGCLDQGGIARCACDPGYAGPACDQCYPGFAAVDGGTCTPAEQCLPASCSFVGTCSVVSGVATCACNPGYAGPSCGACASGFHRDASAHCVANESCATASPCQGPGTCIQQGDAVACRCDVGSAGIGCETCHPGYHREAGSDGGTTCALDQNCRPETCRFHGTCASDGGTVACDCQPGFSGAYCQTNIDDCQTSTCGTLQCVDLLNSYVCLCGNGSYAQVCP